MDRVFQDSLYQANNIAKSMDRFIIYYSEEDLDDISPSLETISYRIALSDKSLGDLINEKV